jgi:hypothetical protein
VTGISADEFVRRLPVWTALSELFLDTELTATDHARIARIVEASGYSLARLDNIMRKEMLPAFGGNLLSIAGEWAGWSEDQVAVIMRDTLNRCGLARLKTALLSRMNLPPDWVAVRQHVQAVTRP